MSKLKRVFHSCRIDEVPPFCFMKPGMTPEEGTLAAVKAMEMKLPIDALETLFRLRDAREAEKMSAIRAQQRAAKAGSKTKATSVTHNPTPKEAREMSTKLKRCRVCGYRFSHPHPRQTMCHDCIKLSNQAKRNHAGVRWVEISRAARKIHQQRSLQPNTSETSDLHNNRPERAQP